MPTGRQTRIWMGLADGAEAEVDIDSVAIGDEVVVHEHVVPELRDLGRRSIGLIRQNYGMAIAVNAAGLLVSAGGAMSPVVAAILHNASSSSSVAVRWWWATAPG